MAKSHIEKTVNTKETIESPLKYTPLEEIPQGVHNLVESFHETHKMDSIQFRLHQIRNVYFAIKDNQDLICEALEKDFHRSPSETITLELGPVLTEIFNTIASLHKWAKPDWVSPLPLNVITQPVYVEHIPLGVVLIISPFNYPLILSMSALVGALSAGNHVVLKLSESTPHFSQLLTELLNDALDADVFYGVNGAIPETTTLLEQKFDKIMYTGNNAVGGIVAKKAAETLTPVVLELGGKCPTFVLEDTKDKDLPTIARRILWGKFSNQGQTCAAIDYLLVHETVKAKLVDELVKQAEVFFKDIDEKSEITHIIHDRAFKRLTNIIKTTKGRVVFGGKSEATTKFIEPTIIDNIKFSDSSMREELFGPILPIISYSDLKTIVESVRKEHDTPLAGYIFTSGKTSRAKNPDIDYIRKHLRTGGFVINDTLFHVGLQNAPFGGVGSSGHGGYHGIYSYRVFSHERTVVEQDLWNDVLLKARYPPFNTKKKTLIADSTIPQREWFGRIGEIYAPSILFTAWNQVATLAAVGYKFVANRQSS